MFAVFGQLPCAHHNFDVCRRGGDVPGGLPDCSLVSLGAAAGAGRSIGRSANRLDACPGTSMLVRTPDG